jgi:hypothetical protein
MTPPDNEIVSGTAPSDGSEQLLSWIDERERTVWLGSARERAEPERLENGGSLLVDVASVVDHMRSGVRPGLTVWIAVEEALKWWTEEAQTLDHGVPRADDLDFHLEDPDPLRTALVRFVDAIDDTDQLTAGEAFQQAIRRWVTTMSDHYNKGCPWPPPLGVQRWTQ